MSIPIAIPARPRRRFNWSQLSLVSLAGLSALAILILLGMIVWMSLRSGVPGQPSDYSLKNYAAILADPYTYRVMWTTLIFSAVTIVVAVPLGFIFAWLVERTDLRYKALAMSLLSIGILFPTFLKAMGWVFLLHPRIGVINILLMQLFGLSQAPLNIATLTGIGFVQGPDAGAVGVRDDLRGAAQHESGAGRSRQRARSESVAHAWCASSCRSFGRRCFPR